MEIAEQKTATNEPDECDFFLSAFLSAGKSVVDLVSRAKKEPEIDQWETKMAEFDREIIGLMKTERGETVHGPGTTERADMSMIPITKISTPDRGHPAYGDHFSGPLACQSQRSAL